MPEPPTLRLLLSMALALACAWSSVAHAQPPRKAPEPPSEPSHVVDQKATATFREGIAAFDRRDFEAARVAFLQTFALKPSAAVVRRNLGLAEIYSGHYLDGARRLARVLHTTEEGSPEDRARMQESLKKAEAHLERVSVEVKQDGAEIWIDGADLGTSPLPFLWYVAPGAYDVSVQKAGYAAFSQARVARAGAAQHLRIVLDPLVPVAAAAPAPRVPVDVPELTRPNPWLLLGGGAITAGALAAGAAFSLAAASNTEKMERISGELDGYQCPGPAECAELSSAADQHDQQVRLAFVSFVGAGVTGMVTLLYGLLGGGEPASGSAERVARPHEARSKLSAGFDRRSLRAAWSSEF